MVGVLLNRMFGCMAEPSITAQAPTVDHARSTVPAPAPFSSDTYPRSDVSNRGVPPMINTKQLSTTSTPSSSTTPSARLASLNTLEAIAVQGADPRQVDLAALMVRTNNVSEKKVKTRRVSDSATVLDGHSEHGSPTVQMAMASHGSFDWRQSQSDWRNSAGRKSSRGLEVVILQAPPRELDLPAPREKPPMPADLLQRTMSRTRPAVSCPTKSDKLRRSRTAERAAMRRNSGSNNSASNLIVAEECLTEYLKKAGVDTEPLQARVTV